MVDDKPTDYNSKHSLSQNTITVKVHIDSNLCIACGVCAALAENVYEYDPDTAKYTPKPLYKDGIQVSEKVLEVLKETVNACPVGAIKLDIVKSSNDSSNGSIAKG